MVLQDINQLVVTKVCAVSRVKQTADTKKAHHLRERCALALMLSGETEYFDLVANTNVLADPSHILFLPANSSYSYTCLSAGDCLMIEFETEPLENSELLSIERDPEELQKFIEQFEELDRVFVFGRNEQRLVCMSLIYQVLNTLIINSKPDHAQMHKQSLLDPAIRYLEEHLYEQSLDCEKLAEVSGISEVYFRKLFTAMYKMPPITYIRKIRIERAKGLLMADYPNIADIATKVGFANVYHFTRVFKQVTGITPGAFANEHRRKLGLPEIR